MAHLKFYAEERQRFPEQFKGAVVSQHAAEIITNKLCRHFGIKPVSVEFVKCRQGSAAYYRWGRIIKYSWGKTYPITVGVIAHEVSHAILDYKNKPIGHNKRMMKTLEKTLRYGIKNNWWGYLKTPTTTGAE